MQDAYILTYIFIQFWRDTVFDAVVRSNRKIQLDLHVQNWKRGIINIIIKNIANRHPHISLSWWSTFLCPCLSDVLGSCLFYVLCPLSILMSMPISMAWLSPSTPPGWCICEQRACTSANDSLRLWKAQLWKFLLWIWQWAQPRRLAGAKPKARGE